MRGSLHATGSDAEIVGMPTAQRWLDHYGQQARAWLDQAPEVARSWAQQWNLTLGAPLEGGSVSVVFAAERQDGPVVLKLAAPWSRWSRAEAAALRAWSGHGAVRLLAASEDPRALLLERVWPGMPADNMTATGCCPQSRSRERGATPLILLGRSRDRRSSATET